jgi:hypothetical protein
MNAPKRYWLAGIGLMVLVQLLLAYGLTQYPNVLAVPPLRLSLIIVSQLIVGIAIGFRLSVTNGARRLYSALLILLFFVRTESLISFVVLAGFAILNTVFLLKLAVARVKD